MTQDCINDSTHESSFLTTVERFGDWELHYPESLLEIWDIWHNPEQFSKNAGIHSSLDRHTNINWEDTPKEDGEQGFKGKLTFGDYLGKRLRKLQATMVNLLHAENDYLNPVTSDRKISHFEDMDIEKEVLFLFGEIPEDYLEDLEDDGFPHGIKRIPPSRERLERFTRQSYLRNAIRRFLNLKYNPSGVDFDSKIREAGRELIESGKVELKNDVFQQKKAESQIESEEDNDAALQEMDEAQNNAVIRFYSRTLLKLAGAPDKRAAYSNYTLRKNEIPMFRPRHGNKVSIISPMDAKDLVEKLLYVFDGWVSFPELRKAAWNHVRHTERFVSFDTTESMEKHIKKQKHIDFPRFDDELINQEIKQQVCSIRSDEIWDGICKRTTDKFFCLYILPEDFPYMINLTKDRHVWKEKDFGSTSTMSDQRTKVLSWLKEETFVIVEEELNEDPNEILNKPREPWSAPPNSTKSEIKDIMVQIFNNLNHRCNEIGYCPETGRIIPPQETQTVPLRQTTKSERQPDDEQTCF